ALHGWHGCAAQSLAKSARGANQLQCPLRVAARMRQCGEALQHHRAAPDVAKIEPLHQAVLIPGTRGREMALFQRHDPQVVQRRGDPPTILSLALDEQALFEQRVGALAITAAERQRAKGVKRDTEASAVAQLTPA